MSVRTANLWPHAAAILLGLWVLVPLLTADAAEPTAAKQGALEPTNKYVVAEHLLDGTSFEYFYQTGGGLRIEFYAGQVRYEWITGPRKGNRAADIPYQSRKIGEKLFLVNWQEKDKPDFVTVVINLKEHVMYSSAILRYGTPDEMIHFNGAIIERVRGPLSQ